VGTVGRKETRGEEGGRREKVEMRMEGDKEKVKRRLGGVDGGERGRRGWWGSLRARRCDGRRGNQQGIGHLGRYSGI
jgi:hypothetical protein